LQGVTNQRKISAAVALTVSQIAKPPAGRDAYPKPGFKPVVEIPYLHAVRLLAGNALMSLCFQKRAFLA
jgi:hypothetical protein